MSPASKKVAQKAIAMIVVAAMLDLVGLSPALIIFFFIAGFLVWLVVLRSHRRDAREVFDFYLAADEILRDEERHWYGFEISEVVDRGERVLAGMPDPPPLLYFSLGALQYRAGDYESAVENLAQLVEFGLPEEHQRAAPSLALRLYVEQLRNMEREPAIAPITLLLAESRERLQQLALEPNQPTHDGSVLSAGAFDVAAGAVNSPRTISEVLHDVYEDEKTA